MHAVGKRPFLLLALLPLLCGGIVLEQGTEITQGIGLDPLQGGGGGVDVTAPQVSGLSCVPASATTANCSFTTSENATSQIDYAIVAPVGWVTFPASDATADNTSHSVSLTGLQEGAPYYYRARTQDADGNLTVTAALSFTTPDETDPVLSGLSLVGTTETTARFVWDNSELADCQLECGTSTGVYTITSTLDNTDTLACDHTITGLTGSTPYFCRGISSDTAGNTGTSAEGMATTTGGVGSMLAPPDLGDLAIAGIDANRVCRDTDDDGDCDDYRYKLKLPEDTSGWGTPVDLGNNPSASTVASTINGGSGCAIFEASGEIQLSGSGHIEFTRDCFLLRGKSQTHLKITVQSGASHGNDCSGTGGDVASFVNACGTRGSTQAWTSGYDKDDNVLGVADVSAFSVYSEGTPYAANTFVQVSSDSSGGTCPEHLPRPAPQARNVHDALHRVVAIVDADGAGPGTAGTITIDPPLFIDYDEELPNCGNFDVRPATLPVAGFDYIDFSTVDGDEGCTFPAIDSTAGCNFARNPLLHYRYAQGWVTNSVFHNNITDFFTARFAADILLMGNEFYNPTSGFTQVQFQATFVRLGEGATSSGIVDNYFHDLEQAVQLREGGRGNVIAHNYQTGIKRSGFHLHGLYSGPNLMERNDMMGLVIDRTWGLQGPENVTYANYARNDTQGNPNALGRYHDGPSQFQGPPPAAPTTSLGTGYRYVHIGDRTDKATGWLQTPFTFVDDHNSPEANVEYLWTGSWGSGGSIGSCSTCTLSNNNLSATQPSAHAAADAPLSLFRFRGREESWPPYWCVEGADWSDPHENVGAFNDVQPDLPAKRRANAQACTLCDSVGGVGC